MILLKLLLPNNSLPKSNYFLAKIINKGTEKTNSKKFFFCNKCDYIGTHPKCTKCFEDKSRDFLVYSSIISFLRSKYQSKEFCDDIVTEKESVNPLVIDDLHDGAHYKVCM